MRKIIVACIVFTVASLSSQATPIGPAIGSVSVPSDGSSVSTPFPLDSGKQYWILAQGVYYYDFDKSEADAEWSAPAGQSWTDVGGDLYDLLVQDADQSWLGSAATNPNPVQYFSSYTPNVFSAGHHTYWLPWEGSGQGLTFRIHDGYYADNSGSLTVSVYTPEPCCALLLAVGSAMLLKRRSRRDPGGLLF